MPRTNPVPDDVVAKVAELHAQGMSRNRIRAELKCGSDTVTRAARQAGLTFDTTYTRAATKARQWDAAHERAEAQVDELKILRTLQGQVLDVLAKRRPYRLIMRGEMGVEDTRDVDFIPSGDQRNLAQAREKSVTIIARLAELNSDVDLAEVRSLLDQVAAGFGLDDDA